MTICLPEDFRRGSLWITLIIERYHDEGGSDLPLLQEEHAFLTDVAEFVGRQIGESVRVVPFLDDIEVAFTSESWPKFKQLCARVFGEDFALPPGVFVGETRGATLQILGDEKIYFRDRFTKDSEDLDVQILSPIPTLRGPRLLSDATLASWISGELRER